MVSLRKEGNPSRSGRRERAYKLSPQRKTPYRNRNRRGVFNLKEETKGSLGAKELKKRSVHRRLWTTE